MCTDCDTRECIPDRINISDSKNLAEIFSKLLHQALCHYLLFVLVIDILNPSSCVLRTNA